MPSNGGEIPAGHFSSNKTKSLANALCVSQLQEAGLVMHTEQQAMLYEKHPCSLTTLQATLSSFGTTLGVWFSPLVLGNPNSGE